MKGIYTEKLLVYRVQRKHDADAYGDLYDHYVDKIYRFVFIKVSNKEIAEDITSDVFLKTWNYLIGNDSEYIKEIKSFSGLIYRIARTTLIDFFRQSKHRNEFSLEGLDEQIHPAHESPFLSHINAKYDADKIFILLKKMKREYQEIILLKYIDELSTREIAQILNKNTTAVRVTLHRAMKILKQLLQEQGYESSSKTTEKPTERRAPIHTK